MRDLARANIRTARVLLRWARRHQSEGMRAPHLLDLARRFRASARDWRAHAREEERQPSLDSSDVLDPLRAVST